LAQYVATRFHPDRTWIALAMLGLLAWFLATAPLPIAALAVGGAIAGVLVLIRPTWGLYGLAFAVPFGALRETTLGPARLGGTEVWLAFVLAAWLAQRASRHHFGNLSVPLRWPLAAFIGLALFSTLWATSLEASLKELIKWGEVGVLYLFIASEVEKKEVLPIALAMALAGALAAAQGIFQAVTHSGPAGFLFPLAGHVFLRAYGTFEQPNPYAGYLGLTAPLAYGILLGVWSPGASAGKGILRLRRQVVLTVVAGAALGLMTVAMLLTLSRGGWMGFAAAALIVSVLVSRRTAALLTLGIFLGSAALLLSSFHVLPPSLVQRATNFVPYLGDWDITRIVVTPQNFALVERLAHWRAGWLMFMAHPWTGVGFGNYPAAYPLFAMPDWTDPLGHAHNYYLNVLAELGLGGLLAYLALWAAAFRLAWLAVRRSSGVERGIAVGILGVLIHLSVHNLVDNLFVHAMYLQVAMVLGLLAVQTGQGHGTTERRVVSNHPRRFNTFLVSSSGEESARA